MDNDETKDEVDIISRDMMRFTQADAGRSLETHRVPPLRQQVGVL